MEQRCRFSPTISIGLRQVVILSSFSFVIYIDDLSTLLCVVL